MTPAPSVRTWAAAWGLLGVTGLLGQAILRLGAQALEPLQRADLTGPQWAALAVTVGVFAWTEGVQGFHRQFSPRVVSRASRLGEAPTWVRLLAPAACMGLIWASRRRRIVSWVLLTMIVGLVVAVRSLPYPWRQIVDAGVVVGLSMGVASLGWHLARALGGALPEIDPELPPGITA